jgi:ubiquinone/menaquinone biosynthesis C-methylase UbiE
MQSFFNLEEILSPPEPMTKLAYQAFLQGKSYFSLAHKALSTQIANLFVPQLHRNVETLSPEILLKLQQRVNKIIETDWQDAQKGIYPQDLLFNLSWIEFLRNYPLIWFDMPGIWQRIAEKKHQDFSQGIDTRGYPDYYVQNFHHQTDGYLSEQSAELYDLQVEILFNGLADAMRRRILAPLKAGLQVFDEVLPQEVRVLDIACGTGRTLRGIRATLPQASLYGTDLSPAYLRKANQLLSERPGELPQLLQANAEDLPYQDNYFHGVTSVFLFHELPPKVRQNVIEEAFRVVKPGGTFIICDSMQLEDSPEFATMLQNFPTLFHEPYYRHYTTDNITERLETVGFENVEIQNHFVSKYWIAHKPA